MAFDTIDHGMFWLWGLEMDGSISCWFSSFLLSSVPISGNWRRTITFSAPILWDPAEFGALSCPIEHLHEATVCYEVRGHWYADDIQLSLASPAHRTSEVVDITSWRPWGPARGAKDFS